MATSKMMIALQQKLTKRLQHGENGVDGQMGPMGPQGPKGDVGPQGAPGSDATLPRSESLTGTTDANGEVTFSYSAFSSVPHVHLSFIAPNANTYIRITAITLSSCTVKVEARAGLTLLGLTLLAFAVTNVSGVVVRAKIGL